MQTSLAVDNTGQALVARGKEGRSLVVRDPETIKWIVLGSSYFPNFRSASRPSLKEPWSEVTSDMGQLRFALLILIHFQKLIILLGFWSHL